MSDHELCLLAAKAAGYLTETWAGSDAYIVGMLSRWNPLEVDADAFRLMVDVPVYITIHNGQVDAVVWPYEDEPDIFYEVTESFGTDKHAATRRAIVRAAAAMGDAK